MASILRDAYDLFWETDWQRILWHEWGNKTRVHPLHVALGFICVPAVIVFVAIVLGIQRQKKLDDKTKTDKEV
jgi:hypothetical protein